MPLRGNYLISLHYFLHLQKEMPFKYSWTSMVAQMVKNPPAMRETWVQSLGWEDPLEKGTATHSSILAWRIPWTEEPGRLQSMGSHRVRHDWVTKHTAHYGQRAHLQCMAYSRYSVNNTTANNHNLIGFLDSKRPPYAVVHGSKELVSPHTSLVPWDPDYSPSEQLTHIVQQHLTSH